MTREQRANNEKRRLVGLLPPLLCLLFVGCTTAQTQQAQPKTYPDLTPINTGDTQGKAPSNGVLSTATLASIYDGDTFKVNLQCSEPVLCHNVPVRVKGVDTPELKSNSPCEKQKAQQAKAFTTSFLQGHKLDLRNCKRDKYFRLLCDVYSEGRSLASELIKRGLAYPYNGGTKAKKNYCK